MKVLVINNNTHYKKKLDELLKRHDTTFINYDQLSGYDVGPFDVIVLSGGGIVAQGRKRSLVRFSHLYEDQIELVKTTTKPVVGICLGCQIIGYAYGAKLQRYFKSRRKGLFPIVAIRENTIMGGLREAMVFQSNHWIMTQLPPELICIAASDEGAEIIKYRKRQLWGVQFHPEREQLKSDGRKIFNRILKKIEKSLEKSEVQTKINV